MTDKNLTEVAIILDRSGSMQSMAHDMEGGFKKFIDDQRKLPGRCVVSLYQFDNEHEVVFEERDVHVVTGLNLVPRGSTALLDAVGRTVVSIGERLSKKPEEERPGAVIVMIITDGHENASLEFTKAQVKALVERQQKEWKWQFVYLGADASTFADAHGIGIRSSGTALYSASAKGARAAYSTVSNTVGTLRQANATGTLDGWSANLGGELPEQDEA